MNTRTCYCRNRSCPLYGQSGPRAQLRPRGTHNHAPRFKCEVCGHLVFARTGTAYAGIRMDETRYRMGTKLLAEGLAIRAVARILEEDKDTVCDWLPGLRQHCARVMAYHFRDLHLSECQLDELWTFVYKKEEHLDPIEQLAGLYGEAWIWIAFTPVWKLVPAWWWENAPWETRKCSSNGFDPPPMGIFRSLPAMICPTMPMRCWMSMA